MKTKLLALFLCLLFVCVKSNIVVAQKASNHVRESSATDSITVSGLRFDSLSGLKKTRDFAYMNYIDSLLRIKNNSKRDSSIVNNESNIKKHHQHNSESSVINKLMNSKPAKIFFWLLAVGFLGFVLFNLIFKKSLLKFKRKKVVRDEVEETFHGLDDYEKYDRLIKDAEANNNFNLAIRYLFLQVLKGLADKQKIIFSAEKTNYSYLSELPLTLKEEYKNLVRNYEYLWYGKFNISSEKYQRLKVLYKEFNNKINLV